VNSRRFTGQVYQCKEKEVRQSSSSSPFASPTSSELYESDVFYLQEKKDVVFIKGETSKRGPNMRKATCARYGYRVHVSRAYRSIQQRKAQR